ncbi:MAG: amino acid transporter-like [Planctomycetota bacterium]|nr:MAG: amino acid transporter-like [Planctomycetota bacterium]
MGHPAPFFARTPSAAPEPPDGGWFRRTLRFLVGPPRDLRDRSIFRHLSLVAFLAWVGLGADGLSSSSYGPEEAFRTMGEHSYLALALAVVMATTVLVIAAAYSRVIEQFPHGGGGYVVATKLLGERAGLVSGSALLVDYVLTVTVSIAAAGDALFSLLPLDALAWKLPAEAALLGILVLLNLRGVKESVLVLTPIFLFFVVTHLILIGGGVLGHAAQAPAVFSSASKSLSSDLATLGLGAILLRFLHAYSLGGGTYTGIEAVSNGLSIMREPRVQTGKRTMFYMATSLAFTASGLLLCYLLWKVEPVAGKTLNWVLADKFAGGSAAGRAFLWITIASEGALLVVAAQAGFVDGPRVLANMAVDSWVPRRFAALSDRLSAQNGIVLMGAASVGALLYTDGDVRALVVMYSINVFLTFSMTTLSMVVFWFRERRRERRWKRKSAIHATAFVMCATILVVTVFEKFEEGGWLTLAITGGVIGVCVLIRRHYNAVTAKLAQLYRGLLSAPTAPEPASGIVNPANPVAAVLVAGYGGLGLHTFLGAFRDFPGQFKGAVFISVGVIDSQQFKGEETMEALRTNVRDTLKRYVEFARNQGIPATYRMAFGTDAVEECEKLCGEVSREFRRAVYFAGKVLFGREQWYQHFLHNETAFAIQQRLQWAGKTVVVVPARVT